MNLKAPFQQLLDYNQYLNSQTPACLEALSQLNIALKDVHIDYLVLMFTYEQLELSSYKEGKFTAHPFFEGVLSKEALDGYAFEVEEHEDIVEDYAQEQFSTMQIALLEIWLLDCCQKAGFSVEQAIPFYFKYNHDSLEVLDLHTGDKFHEASELELFYQNNMPRAKNILPSL